MRLLAGIAMAVMAVCVWAGSKVPICMNLGSDGPTVIVAEKLASKMFAEIGVENDWGRWPSGDSCSKDGAIVITLSYESPSTDHPGVWGYSLPFEGRHIVVFWDRIQHKVAPTAAPCLLAHVMVHEISHILQGIVRHSESGVMKSAWDPDDLARITRWKPLAFTDLDVDLIHRGLAKRLALDLRK